MQITDFGKLAAQEASQSAALTGDEATAARERADVYARLSLSQQQKVQNIIAYLNSDLERWDAGDEAVVRQYLGLAATGEAPPVTDGA